MIQAHYTITLLSYLLFDFIISSLISGKTLILKERVIRSKMKNRDVVLLSLGSSNFFGVPLKTPLVYDVLSKREMKNHQIDFYNATDLCNATYLEKMVQHKSIAPVKGDNRQFVMETCGKCVRGEITYQQAYKIFDDAGIDRANAGAYYNENRSSNAQRHQVDVYDALIDFVKKKKNRGKDISVDEVPILMNPKSKIIFLFILKSYIMPL